MKASTLQLGLLALVLTACDGGHGERTKSGRVPFPVGFPDIECEPGPEPAEVSAIPVDRIDLAPGETATVDVYVTRNGYCGPIDVEIYGLPDGVHSERTSVPWPATLATVQVTAADALPDDIRHVDIRTWTSQERWFEITLRTRASAEPNWSDEIVGIRQTRAIWPPNSFDGNRIVFSDYEWTAPKELTPVIQCIQPGIGRCTDFGESGSVWLAPIPYGGGAGLALAPDGSFLVTVAVWEPSHRTTWARLTPTGDLSPFPGIASAATDTMIGSVYVDPSGRMLFTSTPDGWSIPNTLLRLNPDGSLDNSFGDGGVLPGVGKNPIRVLPDGRIVLGGTLGLLWLENDGTPIGPPVPTPYCCAVEALDDGSVLYGQLEDPYTAYEKGTVRLVDSTGTLVRRWDLGPEVQPLGLAIRAGELLVVAQVVSASGAGSGILRLFRLPLDSEPVLLAERTVGSTVWGAQVSSSGPLVIVGPREFRLPGGGVGWSEAYVWRVE